LKDLGYTPVVFFCNPNIDTEAEFIRRLDALKFLCGHYDVELLVEQYKPEEYLNYVLGYEAEPERGLRCDKCVELRLIKSAIKANQLDIDKFTTTLPISPHKNFVKNYDNTFVNAIRENKWFKTLENFDESSEINFGREEKKLNTIVNVQTNKAIKLNCTIDSNDDNTVLIGETDKEIDGQKTKYTTLEIKDGKAFLNKINTYLFKNEGGKFVNDDNEVATVNDVLDHALMSIDDNGETVKNAIIHNESSKNGRINGMKFGKDGNVDASTLCNFKVGIAHGQKFENINDAKIPIIYKSGNDVHTPLQGNLDYFLNHCNEVKLFLWIRL
jgi:hypothetical protein